MGSSYIGSRPKSACDCTNAFWRSNLSVAEQFPKKSNRDDVGVNTDM